MLLVDDGSTDATARGARSAGGGAPGPDPRPVADAERAARRRRCASGLRDALAAGAEIVGYLDADLSTPPAEIDDLLAALARPGVQVAIGARVGMLGYDIDRSAVRHYLGRVFATAASIILRARVYDTQCGAKLFRAGPALSEALATPFLSRWAFDVELLGRLLIGTPARAGSAAGRHRRGSAAGLARRQGVEAGLGGDGAHAARSGAGRERLGSPRRRADRENPASYGFCAPNPFADRPEDRFAAPVNRPAIARAYAAPILSWIRARSHWAGSSSRWC